MVKFDIMKQLLSIVWLFSCFFAAGQIEVKKKIDIFDVGEVKEDGLMVARMSYMIRESGDSTFNLSFRNGKYQSIIDFEDVMFRSEGGTFNAFYGIMKSAFTDENKKNEKFMVSFKLGKENVFISNGRNKVMFFTVIIYLCDHGQ